MFAPSVHPVCFPIQARQGNSLPLRHFRSLPKSLFTLHMNQRILFVTEPISQNVFAAHACFKDRFIQTHNIPTIIILIVRCRLLVMDGHCQLRAAY